MYIKAKLKHYPTTQLLQIIRQVSLKKGSNSQRLRLFSTQTNFAVCKLQ